MSHSKSVFSPFFSCDIFILLNPPLGNSFLLEQASFPLLSRSVNPGGMGSRDRATLQILGRGLWVVAGRVAAGSLGSWTGREILLYLRPIMYRKYIRKW